jgi:hypothetical protein
MVNVNEEPATGSIYESAQECLEDNLGAWSTETLIALHQVINKGMDSIVWLNVTLLEMIETRHNAAA